MPLEGRRSQQQQRCGGTCIVLSNVESVETKLQRIAEKDYLREVRAVEEPCA
jgi:hypothetical protein